MNKLVMLNESCRYFEPYGKGLLLRKTGKEINAGIVVPIGNREIRCFDHRDIWCIPFSLKGKTYYFQEEELQFQEMKDQGKRNYIGPKHEYIHRYSEKGGNFDLLPDAFIIGKPGFTTSIPFYSKRRGIECLSGEVLVFKTISAIECFDIADAIKNSDLPDEYTSGDYLVSTFQKSNMNMRSADIAEKSRM